MFLSGAVGHVRVSVYATIGSRTTEAATCQRLQWTGSLLRMSNDAARRDGCGDATRDASTVTRACAVALMSESRLIPTPEVTSSR